MRVVFLIILSSAVILCNLQCGRSDTGSGTDPEKLDITVSILPQKYFVERIGGNLVNVTVIVKPGQNHEVYEPTPQQMEQMSKSVIYFRTGVFFESYLVGRISSVNRKLKIVDTRTGVPLRKIESFHSIENIFNKSKSGTSVVQEGDKGHRHAEGNDPHVWLNPLFVKIQAKTIFNELSSLDPGHLGVYKKNYEKFISDLDEADKIIREILSGIKSNRLVIFHPSMGYFADRYGLVQVPIEVEGKDPGQRELASIIDFLKREKIKTIFIQKEVSSKSALTIASSIGGNLVIIDPISGDYINNLKIIAGEIKVNIGR